MRFQDVGYDGIEEMLGQDHFYYGEEEEGEENE